MWSEEVSGLVGVGRSARCKFDAPQRDKLCGVLDQRWPSCIHSHPCLLSRGMTSAASASGKAAELSHALRATCGTLLLQALCHQHSHDEPRITHTPPRGATSMQDIPCTSCAFPATKYARAASPASPAQTIPKHTHSKPPPPTPSRIDILRPATTHRPSRVDQRNRR
jgi:hypothetical protein